MAQVSGKGTTSGKHKRAASEGRPLPNPDHSRRLASTTTKPVSNGGASRGPEGVGHASRKPASPRGSPRKNRKGGKGSEGSPKNMAIINEDSVVQTVEIRKRPGQSLGFYIREGNASDRLEGVFVSRIAPGSMVENNSLLRVGDEILSVNSVDVTRMSLDDVVILMSIPKRLVLTIRTYKGGNKNSSCPSLTSLEPEEETPVVVLKKGRSSSVTAMEMTEKCPDEFILTSRDARSYYSKHDPRFLHRLEDITASKMKGPGPPLPALHIASPVDKQYVDDSGDSGLSSENSAYSQGSQVQAPSVGESDCTRFLSEHQKHSFIPSPLVASDRHMESQYHKGGPIVTVTSPRTGRRTFPLEKGVAQMLDPEKSMVSSRSSSESLIHRYNQPSSYIIKPVDGSSSPKRSPQQSYGHMHTTSTDARLKSPPWQRCASPDTYNSDSELVYSVADRDFGSPHRDKPDSMSSMLAAHDQRTSPGMDQHDTSTEEIQQWLQKFDSLSHQLKVSTSSHGINPNQVPGNAEDPYGSRTRLTNLQKPSGLGSQWVGYHLSPSLPRKTLAYQKPPVSQRRVTRKLSADSLLDYRTYQMEEDELLFEPKQPAPAQSNSSQSQSTSILNLSRSSSGSRLRQNSETDAKNTYPPTSRLRDLHLSRKPLQINIDDFRTFQPNLDSKQAAGLTKLDGILSVHIYCGHGLKSSRTMLRDLYCVLELDGVNKARTMIRTGAINFDWDEEFDLELDCSVDMGFLVYNWDPNTRHRLCFSGAVCLPHVLQEGSSQKIAMNLEPKGIMYVQLVYREPAVSLQRAPSVRKNSVFGMPLESVIRREKSTIGVPVLVQRCVEEVERRGLDHVGIYRLCGSAKRKTILKQDFDQNSWTADVSPEAISDVNVITGVLKDFLRELPEPLFTNALYQMLLDALSVRLPGDPEGSARLMLSILECLPKSNQDTLAYLLDHLKRVSLKSDINKMTSHNLAICFGPVLLCPSPQMTPNLDITKDFKKHIEVVHYLLEIWPQNRGSLKHGTCMSGGGKHDTVHATPFPTTPNPFLNHPRLLAAALPMCRCAYCKQFSPSHYPPSYHRYQTPYCDSSISNPAQPRQYSRNLFTRQHSFSGYETS